MLNQTGVTISSGTFSTVSVVDSVGRRNTRIKTLSRSFEPERLAWPLIKLSRDLIQALL
jgi:hypothetical protein